MGGRRKITYVSMATSSLGFMFKRLLFRVSMESVQPLACMNTAHKRGEFFPSKKNDQIQFYHTTCHANEEFIYKRDESSNIIKNKSRNMNVTECDIRRKHDRLGLVHTRQVSDRFLPPVNEVAER